MIIVREKPHHRMSLTTSSFISEIDVASADNCRRAYPSNQYATKRRVSRSAFAGYDIRWDSLKKVRLARFRTLRAVRDTMEWSVGVVQTLAIKAASGSTSKPSALCPFARATASTVPEPIIGSRTRKGFRVLGMTSSAMLGAIRAGNGCTASRPSIVASFAALWLIMYFCARSGIIARNCIPGPENILRQEVACPRSRFSSNGIPSGERPWLGE